MRGFEGQPLEAELDMVARDGEVAGLHQMPALCRGRIPVGRAQGRRDRGMLGRSGQAEGLQQPTRGGLTALEGGHVAFAFELTRIGQQGGQSGQVEPRQHLAHMVAGQQQIGNQQVHANETVERAAAGAGAQVWQTLPPRHGKPLALFSSYEWLIGLRYTRAKRSARRNRFISFISGISMAGIALGVAALIIVLSVMNGFQKEVRDRMLSVLAHIEVFDYQGAMQDWQRVAAQAKQVPRVLAAAPYISGQAMLARGDSFSGVLVRGIDPALENQVDDIAGQMKKGSTAALVPGEFNIVLGVGLASNLDVRVGDKVALVVPQGSVTPAGVVPRLKQFNVVGVFQAGHYEYDTSLAFINLDDAAKVFRVDGVTGVRLKVDDMQAAPQIAEKLTTVLDGHLLVRDWSQQNQTWFAAVKTEKRMMFIILGLIIAVAAFNLVSTLVMTVTDKQSDIAILRTLGATPGSIMKIFVVQGALVGLIGTALGVGFGALIAYNIDVIVPAIEHLLGVKFLPKEIYVISAMPSDPRMSDIVSIGLVSVVLSLLATLYPSWSASRVKPAEALRYE